VGVWEMGAEPGAIPGSAWESSGLSSAFLEEGVVAGGGS